MNDKTFDTRMTVDIDLDYPITVKGVDYIALTMRRPKTKDSLKAARHKGSDAERGVLLLADLCNVAPEVVEELYESDAQKLGDQLDAFRGGQAT